MEESKMEAKMFFFFWLRHSKHSFDKAFQALGLPEGEIWNQRRHVSKKNYIKFYCTMKQLCVSFGSEVNMFEFWLVAYVKNSAIQ